MSEEIYYPGSDIYFPDVELIQYGFGERKGHIVDSIRVDGKIWALPVGGGDIEVTVTPENLTRIRLTFIPESVRIVSETVESLDPDCELAKQIRELTDSNE